MKSGDMVIICENSGLYDKIEIFGLVGRLSHMDYGSWIVAVDEHMIICKPENLIMIDAVPQMYEALQDILAAWDGYEMLAALDSDVREKAQSALDAANGK